MPRNVSSKSKTMNWLGKNKTIAQEQAAPRKPVRGRSEMADVKYVFLDVVGFTKDRNVAAQRAIISKLNSVVTAALGYESASVAQELGYGEIIKIPTGDGMAIALLNYHLEECYDIHLRVALQIILKIHQEPARDPMYDFKIRIGVNECKDLVVRDINDSWNVVGHGISQAQRIMSKADGNQILAGSTVYENVRQQEKYFNAFRKFNASDKHANSFPVYQLIALKPYLQTCSHTPCTILPMPLETSGLDIEIPTAFRQSEKTSVLEGNAGSGDLTDS